MSITVAKHDIQKYILTYLTYHKTAKFSDLQPPKVKANLFSYHLKLLLKSDMIEHTDDGYTLTILGLAYIDRLTDDGEFVYRQPKMMTMFVVQNSDGGILLERRTKQPYIDTWTLPNGKLTVDDESLHDAAAMEIEAKLGIRHMDMRQAGYCYIRVMRGDAPITLTFAHIFAFETDSIPAAIVDGKSYIWVRPRKLGTIPLAPAVEQIVARTFFRDPLFFEEFVHDWQSEVTY